MNGFSIKRSSGGQWPFGIGGLFAIPGSPGRIQGGEPGRAAAASGATSLCAGVTSSQRAA